MARRIEEIEKGIKRTDMNLDQIKEPIGKLIIDSGLGEMTQDGLYLHYTDVITMMRTYSESQLKEVKETKYIPMQKCPKCDGQGIVSKPPWISGDQQTWDSTSVNHQCDVCNGQKIIPMFELKELK